MLRKMKAEWQLVCLTHDLLKLWRAAQPDRSVPATNTAVASPKK